jgi:hypothetical protein
MMQVGYRPPMRMPIPPPGMPPPSMSMPPPPIGIPPPPGMPVMNQQMLNQQQQLQQSPLSNQSPSLPPNMPNVSGNSYPTIPPNMMLLPTEVGFDGKMLRKTIARRTIDYNPSVVRYLEVNHFNLLDSFV